jgi:hypothetical protein
MKGIINEPPMSVNTAWQGKRFKTPKYLSYEKLLLYTLPPLKLTAAPYKLILEFGFSNRLADIDNGIKPLIDILQKKYKFNDRDIYELSVRKVIVPKGKEYTKFEICSHIQKSI